MPQRIPLPKKIQATIDAFITTMGDHRRYEIKSEGSDEATIYLYDLIGYDWWTDSGVTAKQFAQDLAKITAGTIHLRINSPGGDVFEARAIQTALRQHPAHVIAHIDGLAASAATYVMLGADEIEAVDGAMFMIHNAWGMQVGNAADMRSFAELLDKIDEGIANDYIEKTGQDREQIEEWMRLETDFTAQEALDNGFIDSIYSPPKKQAASARTKREAENALRDAGFSRSQSKKIVADGYGEDAQRDADDDLDEAMPELTACIQRSIEALKN